jgi:hypothetical protein
MKKLTLLFLVFMLLISSSVMAQTRGFFEAKIGADFLGEVDIDDNSGLGSTDLDLDTGISLTGEYKVPMSNNRWTFGGGINHQLERSIDVVNGEDVNSTAFYGLAQYSLPDSPIYLLGKLGYNTFDLEGVNDDFLDGGLYYGLGAGFTFGKTNNYVFETLYSVNNGELEDNSGYKADFEYSKITMSVGMKF